MSFQAGLLNLNWSIKMLRDKERERKGTLNINKISLTKKNN